MLGAMAGGMGGMNQVSDSQEAGSYSWVSPAGRPHGDAGDGGYGRHGKSGPVLLE